MLPLLSKLFSAEHFGYHSIFVAAIGIGAIVACAGIEMSIMLPKNTVNAQRNILAGIGSTMLFSLLFVGIVFYNVEPISHLLFQTNTLSPLTYLLLIAVVLEALSLLITQWNYRAKRYKRISIARFLQAIAMFGGSLLIYYTNESARHVYALPIGYLLGQAIYLTLSIHQSKWLQGLSWADSAPAQLLQRFKRYPDFATYSLFGNLLNRVHTFIAPFLLLYFFDADIAGYYANALKIIMAPLIISISLGNVFYQQASSITYTNRLKLFTLCKQVIGLSAITAIPISLVILLWALNYSQLFWDLNGLLLANTPKR